MSKILNITNGDSAVDIMKQAGIAGEFYRGEMCYTMDL